MKAGSNLEKVLESGGFAVTAELGPPKGADADDVREKIEMLRGNADAFNITDNQTAVTRLSSIAAGAMLIQAGMEPVIQIVTRDRNRIAIQSDVLGAAALGIKNVLCLTGDHQKFGNHPTALGVFDLDSMHLIAALKKMREEAKFISGDEMTVAPKLFIGAAANPFADPLEFRVIRLAKKINAGADFIQTQGVYDLERFGKWMEMVRDQGLHEKVDILAGIIPIKSVGMASYMKASVPGVIVTDEILARMKGAKKQGKKASQVGLEIAVETIQQVREIAGVRGIHIMAVAWEEAVSEIVNRAGLLPRPQIQ